MKLFEEKITHNKTFDLSYKLALNMKLKQLKFLNTKS